MTLTFGSLFAGIGGFDLGFERAGMVCKWQVEIDPFCQKVLAKHWPSVRRHDDIKTFPEGAPEEWTVDVICGGFPCQDISCAGTGAGLKGERSGLWSEYLRIIRTIQPRFVAIENVPALTVRGLDAVLGGLNKIGFDAEWQVIPVSSFGAPHQRERIFILAYPSGFRRKTDGVFKAGTPKTAGEKSEQRLRDWPGRNQSSGAHSDRIRWVPDSELCGVANGVPDRLDRYRGLGNAIVPQVAEYIGRMIVEAAT